MKRAVARPAQAVGTPCPHAESARFSLELYGAFDEFLGYAEKRQEATATLVCRLLLKDVLPQPPDVPRPSGDSR
ncbi:MAG: hypothetical protein LBR80_15200, partial [Deltaproteobacteria bacterium]|nr:hypothetical protein [Deltaproteobacteria bacterium]